MAKLLTGFVFGVAATIAVFYLIDNRSVEIQESLGISPATSKDLVESERSENESEVVTTTEVGGERSLPRMSADSGTKSDPTTSPVEIGGAIQSGSNASTPPPGSPARTASRDYAPEIADMIEKLVDKDLQAQYETDEREESWATYMEGQLRAYYAQKPELAQITFSLIDCRTSFCEIHALGYGPNALTAWTTGTADFVAQTWHDFKSMSMNQHNPQPDILGIVLILTRQE